MVNGVGVWRNGIRRVSFLFFAQYNKMFGSLISWIRSIFLQIGSCGTVKTHRFDPFLFLGATGSLSNGFLSFPSLSSGLQGKFKGLYGFKIVALL
jgi:hypothetical protein